MHRANVVLLLASASALNLCPQCTMRRHPGPWPTRSSELQCSGEENVPQIPESVAKQIPPEKLAAAWQREEQAKELSTLLKGCQVYLVGLSARKNAVGRALSRRLQNYRLLDAPALMLSTYKAISGGESTVSLEQLMAAEPVADVQQLSSAVMREVQQYTRSIIITWDGAVERGDFAMMQQGLVAHVDFDVGADEVLLPAEGAEEVLERWRAGFAQADVSVVIDEGTPPDDGAALLVEQLITFIKANPARSAEWKADADAKLSEADEPV